MPLSTSVQLNIVLYGFLSGVLTGIIFDFYRILRGVKVPIFIRILQDILFWILAAMIVFCFLLYMNFAFLGVYVYAFMLIAITMYLKFLSHFCITIELSFLKFSSTFIRLVIKTIVYPFKIVIYNIIGKNN